MSFADLLREHFVHTALLAGAVVAVTAGAVGVFVVIRGLSFAVHAVSELGFTGAAAALVLNGDPVIGLLTGRRTWCEGRWAVKGRERDAVIGVFLAFGLGIGVLFLSRYRGYATQARDAVRKHHRRQPPAPGASAAASWCWRGSASPTGP